MTALDIDGLDTRGIDQLPSGKYRLRIYPRGKLVKKIFTSVDEAMRVRDAIYRAVADEEMVPVDGGSVIEFGKQFLGKRETNRGIKTERQRWNTHITTGAFASRVLTTITRRDVLDWLDDLRQKKTSTKKQTKKTLSWQTRKHCLNLLRAFFRWAQDRELITTNPADGVRVDREDGDEEQGFQPGWYLTPDEQKRLLDLADSREKLIIAFAMGTGLRKGEVNCLHLVDVHLDGAPHIVVRFGSYDPKAQRFRSTKGKKGEKRQRIVPLFGLALEAARQWMRILPKYAKRNPLGLMFPTIRGALRDKPPRSWKATVEKFGVNERIGRHVWWHLLRHTCASSLVAGWWGKRWSLDEVREILGHSSVTVTERYAHLAESVIHDVATKAEAAYLATSHVHSPNTVTNGTILAKIPRYHGTSKPNVVGSNPSGRAETERGHEMLNFLRRC